MVPETIFSGADANDCSVMIPREKELGRNYHTIDLLLAHPEIGKFVRWVSKQR